MFLWKTPDVIFQKYICGALARQKQAVLSPSVAAHPFYCAVLLIVKSHKYRASCRACHALAYPFADLLLYILYVLSGAQAHRDHAEDVWRASAPWSCLARKRAVIMSDAQAHRDHAGAQAHRDHVGAQTHRDHAEDVWRASAPWS